MLAEGGRAPKGVGPRSRRSRFGRRGAAYGDYAPILPCTAEITASELGLPTEAATTPQSVVPGTTPAEFKFNWILATLRLCGGSQRLAPVILGSIARHCFASCGIIESPV